MSVGGSIARATVRRAATELREGRFDFAVDAIHNAELNEFMGS